MSDDCASSWLRKLPPPSLSLYFQQQRQQQHTQQNPRFLRCFKCWADVGSRVAHDSWLYELFCHYTAFIFSHPTYSDTAALVASALQLYSTSQLTNSLSALQCVATAVFTLALGRSKLIYANADDAHTSPPPPCFPLVLTSAGRNNLQRVLLSWVSVHLDSAAPPSDATLAALAGASLAASELAAIAQRAIIDTIKSTFSVCRPCADSHLNNGADSLGNVSADSSLGGIIAKCAGAVLALPELELLQTMGLITSVSSDCNSNNNTTRALLSGTAYLPTPSGRTVFHSSLAPAEALALLRVADAVAGGLTSVTQVALCLFCITSMGVKNNSSSNIAGANTNARKGAAMNSSNVTGMSNSGLSGGGTGVGIDGVRWDNLRVAITPRAYSKIAVTTAAVSSISSATAQLPNMSSNDVASVTNDDVGVMPETDIHRAHATMYKKTTGNNSNSNSTVVDADASTADANLGFATGVVAPILDAEAAAAAEAAAEAESEAAAIADAAAVAAETAARGGLTPGESAAAVALARLLGVRVSTQSKSNQRSQTVASALSLSSSSTHSLSAMRGGLTIANDYDDSDNDGDAKGDESHGRSVRSKGGYLDLDDSPIDFLALSRQSPLLALYAPLRPLNATYTVSLLFSALVLSDTLTRGPLAAARYWGVQPSAAAALVSAAPSAAALATMLCEGRGHRALALALVEFKASVVEPAAAAVAALGDAYTGLHSYNSNNSHSANGGGAVAWEPWTIAMTAANPNAAAAAGAAPADAVEYAATASAAAAAAAARAGTEARKRQDRDNRVHQAWSALMLD